MKKDQCTDFLWQWLSVVGRLSPHCRRSGAQSEQTGAALCVVFLLNALALVTFPSIGKWLGLSQEQFGVWAALAIHDTSSVVATAQLYGDEAAEIATTVKIGRTLWLIPLIIAASLYAGTRESKIRIPNFVLRLSLRHS